MVASPSRTTLSTTVQIIDNTTRRRSAYFPVTVARATSVSPALTGARKRSS
jgi:hypothetical protein